MQVSEVMHKGVSTVQISDTIKKVAALMKREDIGAVPVFKNARPVGFVTDRDIVISCVANGRNPDEPISLAMTSDIISIQEKEELTLATKIMREKQVSRLLVVDEKETPVGMLSLQDITRFSEDKVNSVETIAEIKR